MSGSQGNLLSPERKKVVSMRLGLGNGTERTLEEDGQTFQVARKHIRQIEAKALCKLRHSSRARRLQALWSAPVEDNQEHELWSASSAARSSFPRALPFHHREA